MLEYYQFGPLEQTSVNIKPKQYMVIQENAFANVICKTATILSWPECVNRFSFWYYFMLGCNTLFEWSVIILAIKHIGITNYNQTLKNAIIIS